MSLLAKEDICKLIKENDITTVKDIHTILKDMFTDVLQEMLEAEIEDELGYSK